MHIPAQRPSPPTREPALTVHVTGDPAAVSTALRELADEGWQATSAVRVEARLWRLVVRRR